MSTPKEIAELKMSKQDNTIIISRPDSDITVTLHLWDKEDFERLRKIGEELQSIKPPSNL